MHKKNYNILQASLILYGIIETIIVWIQFQLKVNEKYVRERN